VADLSATRDIPCRQWSAGPDSDPREVHKWELGKEGWFRKALSSLSVSLLSGCRRFLFLFCFSRFHSRRSFLHIGELSYGSCCHTSPVLTVSAPLSAHYRSRRVAFSDRPSPPPTCWCRIHGLVMAEPGVPFGSVLGPTSGANDLGPNEAAAGACRQPVSWREASGHRRPRLRRARSARSTRVLHLRTERRLRRSRSRPGVCFCSPRSRRT